MIDFDTDWTDEENFAYRLAEIVSGLHGSRFRPYRKENGGWVLDSGNNWFLHAFDRDKGHWRLSYRYGLSDKLREALQVVLARSVGPARLRDQD